MTNRRRHAGPRRSGPRVGSIIGGLGIVAVAVAVVLLGLPAAGEALAGLVTASGSPTPSATLAPTAIATSEPTSEPTPEPTPSPTPAPSPLAPLTGLPVPYEVAVRPALAVSIDDHPAARPQSGLASADIVLHAPAEGGIGRYVAIFGSRDPGAVGPVRSIRDYLVLIPAEFARLIAHAGGSPSGLALLRGENPPLVDADFLGKAYSYFHRSSERTAPHNLYTSGAKLRALGEKLLGATAPDAPVPPTAFAFAPPAETRPTGASIAIGFSDGTVKYAYDVKSDRWRRSSGGKATVDAVGSTRIAPANVVVLLIPFGPPGIKGRLEASLVGTGDAYVASGGRIIAGTWARASETGPTLLRDAAGVPIMLTPGQTFIEVAPLGTAVTAKPGK